MNSRQRKLNRRSRILASPIFETLLPRIFLSATQTPVLAPVSILSPVISVPLSNPVPAAAPTAANAAPTSATPSDQRTFTVTQLDDDDGSDDGGDDGGADGSDDGSSFWDDSSDDSSWDSSSTDDSSDTQPAATDDGSDDGSGDDDSSFWDDSSWDSSSTDDSSDTQPAATDDGSDDGSSDDGSSFWDDPSWDSSSTDDSPPATQPAPSDDGSSDDGSWGGDNGSDDQTSSDPFGQSDGSQTDDSSDSGDDGTANDYGPSTPVYPPATPTNLTAQALSPTTVQLSWQGDTGNTDDFAIARLDPGHGWNTVADVSGGDTSYTDTNLLPNTLYAYSVTAYNQAGASGSSAAATVSTPALLPIGTFRTDSTYSTLSGWSLDPNMPSASDTITVTVDGSVLTTGSATLPRADLTPLYGSANHGFSVSLPSMSVGVHQIDLFAKDAETQKYVLIAAESVNTNQPPTGSLGQFDGASFKGWAFDANAGSSPIQIQYTLDNNAPMVMTADVSRADLTSVVGSADHGFNVTLPQLTAGTHTLSVYAVDSSTDALTFLGRKTATVANAAGLPTGSMRAPTSTLVKGWARDAATPSASIFVRIDIDNVPGTPFLANSVRPDLMPLVHNADLGFSKALTLSPGEHRITVYMLDSATATPTLLGSQIVGGAVPIGAMQNPAPGGNAGATEKGWALASAAGGDPAMIRLDVGDTPVAISIADVSRPDLMPVVGSADHGFAVTLPVLAPGPHTLSLLVVDPLTLQTTMVARAMFVAA
jgi:hypothetical protein